MLTGALGIILAICLGYFIVKKALVALKFKPIPGPQGKPLVGNYFNLDYKKMHLQLTRYSKVYGPVFTLNMLGEYIVVLNGHQAINQAMNDKKCAGRPRKFCLSKLSNEYCDFLFMDCDTKQRCLKKKVVNHIQAYGVDTSKMDNKIISALKQLNNELSNYDDSLCSEKVIKIFENCVIKLIHDILIGKTLENETEIKTIRDMVNAYNVILEPGRSSDVLSAIPLLHYLGHPIWIMLQEIQQICEAIYTKWQLSAFDIYESKSDKNIMNNFIIKMLISIEENKKDGFIEQHGMAAMWQMFLSGTVQIGSALSMLVNVLMQRPDVQQRLYKESTEVKRLGTVLGSGAMDRLPYHTATIYELLRFSCIQPLAFPRRTTQDTVISNVHIPENTTIWLNLWSAAYDSNKWTNPERFNPDRFLDQSGSLLPNEHEIWNNDLGFGVGFRSCAGSRLATSCLFLAAYHLVQRYEIHPGSETVNKDNLDPKDLDFGFVMHCPEYVVKFVKRNNNYAK